MKRFSLFFIQYKILLGFFVFFSVWLATLSISYAHKVNIFAYIEGSQVYTESYFPDGRKVEGGTIEIYDSQGNKLLTGTTDKEGKFNFTPPKHDDLNIVLIATMGHKNSYLLSKSELSDIITTEESNDKSVANEPTKPTEPAQKTEEVFSPVTEFTSQHQVSIQTDLQEIKKSIKELDKKLAPIIRELAKSKQERVSPTEIFGGIGYIFGLIGLIFYFTKRRA